MAMYLLTSYVVLFTHVHLCYPLFPSVAMDMLFLWQLEVFMDGLRLHCRGLSEPFFTHSLSSSLTNHTSRMHNTVHLCLDLTPHIYLRATPFSFCMPVLRCTKVIMFWSIVQPAVLCKSTRGPENLTVGIRSDEILDAGTVIRFVVCTLLKLESAPQSFLIFNSNRNPSFFFKDAWDILSHGDEERRQRKCFCGRESEGKRRRQLQIKVQLPVAVKQSKEAQWLGTVRARWGVSTCWMNPVSVGEYHGLRVGSALLSIVAGCIIIGVSRECDADAVGGIFLGAGGLGEYVKNIAGTYWSSLAGKFFEPFGFPRVAEWSQNVDVVIWT